MRERWVVDDTRSRVRARSGPPRTRCTYPTRRSCGRIPPAVEVVDANGDNLFVGQANLPAPCALLP